MPVALSVGCAPLPAARCRNPTRAPGIALGPHPGAPGSRPPCSRNWAAATRRATAAGGSGAACRRPTKAMLLSPDRWTSNARLAVKLASFEACKLGQNYVKPEHLLLGILAESADIPALAEKGIAARVLEERGLSLKQARAAVAAAGGATALGLTKQEVELPLTGKAQERLEKAKQVARSMGVPNTIDCEQVLMSLLGEEGGAVPKLLAKQGIDSAQLRDRLVEVAVAETAAVLPAAPGAHKEAQWAGSPLTQLAFLALAAGAAAAQLKLAEANTALACVAGCVATAAAVCLAVLMEKARRPGGPRYTWGRPLLLTALAGAAGWFGSRAAAAALAAEPRLAAIAPCCGAILALGFCSTIA